MHCAKCGYLQCSPTVESKSNQTLADPKGTLPKTILYKSAPTPNPGVLADRHKSCSCRLCQLPSPEHPSAPPKSLSQVETFFGSLSAGSPVSPKAESTSPFRNSQSCTVRHCGSARVELQLSRLHWCCGQVELLLCSLLGGCWQVEVGLLCCCACVVWGQDRTHVVYTAGHITQHATHSTAADRARAVSTSREHNL